MPRQENMDISGLRSMKTFKFTQLKVRTNVRNWDQSQSTEALKYETCDQKVKSSHWNFQEASFGRHTNECPHKSYTYKWFYRINAYPCASFLPLLLARTLPLTCLVHPHRSPPFHSILLRLTLICPNFSSCSESQRHSYMFPYTHSNFATVYVFIKDRITVIPTMGHAVFVI